MSLIAHSIRVISFTIIVCLALCSVDSAVYREDSTSNIVKRQADDAGDDVDPAIAAQCTQCAQLQGVSDDDLSTYVEECILITTLGSDYNCTEDIEDGNTDSNVSSSNGTDSAQTDREFPGYMNNWKWNPIERAKKWIKKNKAKIKKAIEKAAKWTRKWFGKK